MKLIRIKADRRRIIKLTLQSLPIALAAIAFVMYGLTFLPLSTNKMKRSVVLVEYVSCYEIDVDGKPQAWFRAFGDSLSLTEASLVANQKVVDSRMVTGVWINRYDFFPSCQGRVLIPIPDSTASETLSAANKNITIVMQRAVADTEKRIARLDAQAARLRYYLDTHNVNDDGYNTMAAYSAAVDTCRSDEEKLLSVFKTLATGTGASVRHIEKYTLLHSDREGKTERITCHDATKTPRSAYRIVQTADQKKPHGAVALYFHRWIAPSISTGNKVSTVAFFGSGEAGFSTDSLSPSLFPGSVTAARGHDVPSLLAPSGCPVFTEGNRFVGITATSDITAAKSFAFGFNDLLE